MPENEYDPEAAKILAQMRSSETPDQFAVLIANVLRVQFDEWTAGHSLRDAVLAREIWAACKRASQR